MQPQGAALTWLIGSWTSLFTVIGCIQLLADVPKRLQEKIYLQTTLLSWLLWLMAKRHQFIPIIVSLGEAYDFKLPILIEHKSNKMFFSESSLFHRYKIRVPRHWLCCKILPLTISVLFYISLVTTDDATHQYVHFNSLVQSGRKIIFSNEAGVSSISYEPIITYLCANF